MKQIEKICTGCGRSSLNPISEQYAACCPDNNYVEISNNKQHMKLYTEEEVMKLMLSMKTYIESHNLIFQVKLEQLTPIELPSDEEIYLMSEKYAEKCGLRNFFDEDEVTIMKHHWVMGYESAIKDFSRTKIQGGNK